MNFEKYTQSSISVLNSAQEMAKENNCSELKQSHLFYEMLNKKTLIYEILEKMNIDCENLKNTILNKLKTLPKVSGQSEVYGSNELVSSLSLAENIAKNIDRKSVV